MVPRWIRRTLFFGALALGALAFASVAEPESCASIWTLEAHRSPCCASSHQPKLTKPGGDCCDFSSVEERDPGASTAPVVVPPAQWVRVEVADDLAPAPKAQRYAALAIPERPPDRAIATTVLLI